MHGEAIDYNKRREDGLELIKKYKELVQSESNFKDQKEKLDILKEEKEELRKTIGNELSFYKDFDQDKTIFLNILSVDPHIYSQKELITAISNFRDDREVALAVAKNYPDAFEYLSESLKNDREVVLEAIEINTSAFEYASPEIRSNKKISMEVVKKNGKMLCFVSGGLDNDKEIVYTAARNRISSLIFASKELKEDVDFVKSIFDDDENKIKDYLLSLKGYGSSGLEEKKRKETIPIIESILKNNMNKAGDSVKEKEPPVKEKEPLAKKKGFLEKVFKK